MATICNDTDVSDQDVTWTNILQAIRSLKAACSVKATAFALHSYCGSKSHCWPSVATLAADTGLSPRSIHRAIKSLVEAGMLVVERRTRKDGSYTSNLYRFVVSTVSATVSDLDKKPNPTEVIHASQGHEVQKKTSKSYQIEPDTFGKYQSTWRHYRIALANKWIDGSEATLVDWFASWAKCNRLKRIGKTENPAALFVSMVKRKLLSKFPSHDDENAGRKAIQYLRLKGLAIL